MTAVAIIGSAGRKQDRMKVSRKLYGDLVVLTNQKLLNYPAPITLVSGGAAFVDHLAVNLYCAGDVEHLILHLPAPFNDSKFIGTDWNSPGKIANHYHDIFSRKIGYSSLRQIQLAIDKGAEIHIHNGFFARNKLVGNVDVILAYTFGTANGRYNKHSQGWKNPQIAGLKPGGTSHTWQHSNAPIKDHTNLNFLI